MGFLSHNITFEQFQRSVFSFLLTRLVQVIHWLEQPCRQIVQKYTKDNWCKISKINKFSCDTTFFSGEGWSEFWVFCRVWWSHCIWGWHCSSLHSPRPVWNCAPGLSRTPSFLILISFDQYRTVCLTRTGETVDLGQNRRSFRLDSICSVYITKS